MKRNVFFLVLAALAVVAPAALAQSDLGLKRVGLALGYVDPEQLGGTFSVGIFADHGTIAPRVGLESRLDYWGSTDESFGAKASIRDVSIGTRGKYYFEVTNPKLRPFAGAGLGLHFLKATVTTPAQFGFPALTVEGTSTKLGLDFGGGVATAFGPRTDLLAEAWFGVVDGANTFSLRVGLSHKLGS